MKLIRTLLAGAAIALCLASVAQADAWSENYDAAVAQAKASHKTVLLDFTGSDWCVWCHRIDKEVFAQQAFKDFADKNLILVKVDFPREHPQDASVKAQNEKLKQKYAIEGYPTLIAIDGNGKILFTQTGYEPGGADPFIAKFPKS